MSYYCEICLRGVKKKSKKIGYTSAIIKIGYTSATY